MGTSKSDYPDDLVRGLMTRPEASEVLLDDPGDASANGKSRTKRKKPRGRPRKEKRPGRNLKLSKQVFDRLQLEAIKREWTVSDVAEFFLDGALPKHAITTTTPE